MPNSLRLLTAVIPKKDTEIKVLQPSFFFLLFFSTFYATLTAPVKTQLPPGCFSVPGSQKPTESSLALVNDTSLARMGLDVNGLRNCGCFIISA
ncbi:uncharacterized [Tachysurus ichikawai]